MSGEKSQWPVELSSLPVILSNNVSKIISKPGTGSNKICYFSRNCSCRITMLHICLHQQCSFRLLHFLCYCFVRTNSVYRCSFWWFHPHFISNVYDSTIPELSSGKISWANSNVLLLWPGEHFFIPLEYFMFKLEEKAGKEATRNNQLKMANTFLKWFVTESVHI